MTNDRAEESFLLEPVKRVAVFEALLAGPSTRSDLGEELDVSRATLHRIVTFLDDEALIEERDGTLSLTSLGEVVAGEVTSYVDRMSTARNLAPLLNGIDLDAVPATFDLALFEDARATRPKPGQPQRPAQRVVEMVEEADHVKGFGPVLLPIYVEVFHREILDGTETELLIEPDVVEGLEGVYAEKFEEALETGDLAISVHEHLPFGLVLTPDAVGLLGYDEEEFLRILVESTDETLREWAEDVFNQYAAEATALTE